jgi:exodeoxyribonuclease VII large subunit
MTARTEAAKRAVREEGRALTANRPDLRAARQRAAELVDRSARAVAGGVERRSAAAAGLRDALRALGPVATLERGYAVARLADGSVLRDPAAVASGDGLEIIVAGGRVETTVTGATPRSVEEWLQ